MSQRLQRPPTDRLAGCHHWASGIHASLGQLAVELDDLGQRQAAKRVAIARQQIELACGELEAELASRNKHGYS